jgi:acetate kinase
MANERLILTINTGSSSVKAAVFAERGGELRREVSLTVERIGRPGSTRSVAEPGGEPISETAEIPDFAAALDWVLDRLGERGRLDALTAAGHRVVHGGERHIEPERVTPELIADLRGLIPIDPEHLPQAIAAIEAIAKRLPDLPQIACFDTAFHNHMPRVSKLLPLPRWLEQKGVRRYGFHGLSCESLMAQLRQIDPGAADGRLVIAHLGAGASLTAVSGGIGVDTTMGFTPTGGIMMATRPGDLDPGVLLYLLQVAKLPPERINRLLNAESGLLGVSATSADLRDLLAAEEADERAAEAIALFCHIAAKHLAGLISVLGGLDQLIFTGGIGQHAVPVRRRICERFAFIGLRLDPAANEANREIISAEGSDVTARVMATDEELAVARHVRELTG